MGYTHPRFLPKQNALPKRRLLGDPHGLDDGTRCAGLVLRALTAIYEVEPPADAPARRALWERAGVAEERGGDELAPRGEGGAGGRGGGHARAR